MRQTRASFKNQISIFFHSRQISMQELHQLFHNIRVLDPESFRGIFHQR